MVIFNVYLFVNEKRIALLPNAQSLKRRTTLDTALVLFSYNLGYSPDSVHNNDEILDCNNHFNEVSRLM